MFTERLDKNSRIIRAASQGKRAWYQNKFMLLFIFLLGVLLYYPFSMGSDLRYNIYRTLFALVILFTVYAVSMRSSLFVLVLIFAVPSIVQHTVYAANIKNPIGAVNSFLALAFDVYVVVVVFRRIFAKAQADSESIFGALCVYLFVGFSFANIFMLVTYFNPKAFYLDPQANGHAIFDRLDSVYYSFGTMTSLGAAGITPVTGEARLLTILEALVGVLFLAVLVSRLLSAYGVNRSPANVEQ